MTIFIDLDLLDGATRTHLPGAKEMVGSIGD